MISTIVLNDYLIPACTGIGKGWGRITKIIILLQEKIVPVDGLKLLALSTLLSKTVL